MKSLISILCLLPILTIAQVDSSLYSEKKLKRMAKRAEHHRYFGISFGTDSYWNRDYATSPVGYSGTLGNADISYRSISDVEISEFVLGFSGGRINGETDFAIYQATAFSGYFEFNWLKYIPFKPEKWDLYLGLNNFNTVNNRINNNYFNAAYNWDYFSTIGPAARVQTRIKYAKGQKTLFRKKKGRRSDLWVDWDMQMNLPLLFLYTRPSYSVVEDFTDGNDLEAISDIQSAWYPNIWRYTFKTEVVWHLQNGNALQMKYLYDLYEINKEFNPVQSAHHVFNFGILFKLDKKGIYNTSKAIKP